ncbi:hypothetical protein FRB99_001999 [Tulasnella sp. 403]|nr:hypothetical protein FRB99_001999 [Tulasnella sp. 403]
MPQPTDDDRSSQADGRAPKAKATNKVHRTINTCVPVGHSYIDVRTLLNVISALENKLTALYNAFGISKQVRDDIAQLAPAEAEQVKLPISVAGSSQPSRLGRPSSHQGTRGPFIIVPTSRPSRGSSVEYATRIFGSNSILVPLDELLGVWSETLGLDMRPLATPENDVDAFFREQEELNSQDNVIVRFAAIAVDPADTTWTKSPNVEVLTLAYQLFVTPALTNGSMFNDPGSHLLVTPAHVSHLPSGPLRTHLWIEFEAMLVLHSGLLNNELKSRVDEMFQWAEAESRRALDPTAADHDLSPPTLAFFCLVCFAFAIGAQSYECKVAHKLPTTPTSGSSDADMPFAQMSLSSPPHEDSAESKPSSSDKVDTSWSSFGNLTAEYPDLFGVPDDPAFQNGLSVDPSGQSTPKPTAQHLFNLASAARTTHDILDLPPSLDYIIAHILSWLFMIHPADVISFSTNCRGSPSNGSPIAIDQRIWRDLGKVINVARSMGLGVDPDSGVVGRTVSNMGPWEKEMRRRVWWELCYADWYISECMGQPPLIDSDLHDCQVPSDVNDSIFTSTTKELPPPEIGPTGRNLSHFVQRCRLVKLAKQRQRLPAITLGNMESAMQATRDFETSIMEWRDDLPPYLTIQGLTIASDLQKGAPRTPQYSDSDIHDFQACDLYITANALLIRLWTPFLVPTLSAARIDPYPASICTKALSTIVQASAHMHSRFRETRPASLGSLTFARTMFIAGCIASTVVIRGGPELQFADKALDLLKNILTIVNDQVVCGHPQSEPGQYRFQSSRVLGLLHTKADNVFKGNKASLGSKRKDLDKAPHETMKIPAGWELPYAGRGAVTTPCCLHLNYGPIPKPTPILHESPEAEDVGERDELRARATIRVPAPVPDGYDDPRPHGPSESENDTRAQAWPPSTHTVRKKRSGTVQSASSADGMGSSNVIKPRPKGKKKPGASTPNAGAAKPANVGSPGNGPSRAPSNEPWQTPATPTSQLPPGRRSSDQVGPYPGPYPPPVERRQSISNPSIPPPGPSPVQTYGGPQQHPVPITPQAYMGAQAPYSRPGPGPIPDPNYPLQTPVEQTQPAYAYPPPQGSVGPPSAGSWTYVDSNPPFEMVPGTAQYTPYPQAVPQGVMGPATTAMGYVSDSGAPRPGTSGGQFAPPPPVGAMQQQPYPQQPPAQQPYPHQQGGMPAGAQQQQPSWTDYTTTSSGESDFVNIPPPVSYDPYYGAGGGLQ